MFDNPLTAIRPARDEPVVPSHAGSCAFGYRMTLGTFVALPAAVLLGWVDAAFSRIGPVLAAAPSLYMIVAAPRGRAG